jgi:hypothetical protein
LEFGSGLKLQTGVEKFYGVGTVSILTADNIKGED